jgi:hypothetical protein
MNKNRITATLAVMALAGVLVDAVTPQNNADISLDSGAAVQSATAPQPAADASAATTAAPAPTSTPPTSDSLLSEVKVYPSF